jgi:Mce-associated membrane protein
VNTEVVGAGVTRANGEDATVLLVIQSTQESTASPQAQIVRYQIEVALEKVEGRWRLSGIKGTEMPGND